MERHLDRAVARLRRDRPGDVRRSGRRKYIAGYAIENVLRATFRERLAFLDYGLSAVLVLVGVEMLLTDVYRLPTWASLLVIVVLIGTAVIASLYKDAMMGARDVT